MCSGGRGLDSARKMSGRFRFGRAWLDPNSTNPHFCISSWMWCVVTWCDALTDTSKMSHKFCFFFSLLLLLSRTNEPKRWRFFVTSSPENVCFVCVCVQYDIIIIISQRAYKYNDNSFVCLFFSRGGGGDGVWISFRCWPPVTPTFYFEREKRGSRLNSLFEKYFIFLFFFLVCFDWKWNELNCNFKIKSKDLKLKTTREMGLDRMNDFDRLRGFPV